MKSKIHLDINTYEFIEIEKDGVFTPEEIKEFHTKYHKLISEQKVKRSDKVQKREYDFVQDLDPDETINIE